MDINQIVSLWASMLGVGALISVGIQIAKYFNLIADGNAQKVIGGVNLVGVIVVCVIVIFFPDFDLLKADSVAGQLANLLTLVFGYIVSLFGSKFTYDQLRGLPFLGKSFTK